MHALQGEAATSTGAAMLAAVAGGAFRDLAEAAACCVRLVPEAVAPRPETAGTYEQAYSSYRRPSSGACCRSAKLTRGRSSLTVGIVLPA